MSGGLKEQWGVGDAAQVASDAQSQDLKGAFEKAVDAMADHLQYTAANADRARQDPLASRGQALVPRYQDALKQVDAANPATAKPAIDSLLADAESLGKEVAAFRSEIEKAVNEWQSRSGPYDGAVKQVEELSEWQHPKEAAVRSLADAIRGQVNDHAYDKAVATHDQFLPKLQPIYEDLQKRKAAQQQYEPAVASLQPLLAQAAEPSFKKVADKQAEIASSKSAMEGMAQGKDFVAAVAASTALNERVGAYTEQVKQIQQAKDQYEQVAGGIQAKVQAAPSPSPFKKLEAMQAELSNGQKDMESSVQAEEFEQALQKANDLGAKADSYSEQVKQIQQAKDQYEQVAGGIQAKVQAAPSPSPFKKLEAMQAELSNGQKDMESSVQAEEFEQALQKANDLGAKADSYSEQVKQIQQAKDQYEQVAGGIQAKVQAAPSPSPFKKLEAMQAELSNGQKDMESSVQAEEFEQALQKANDLGAKADSYSEQVKQIQQAKDQYEQVAGGIQAKVQAAPSPSPFKKLEAMQAELSNGQKDMESSVQAEEFEQALQKANDLGAKADSYSEQVKQIQQAKDQYEQVAGGIQAKVQAAPSPSPFKKLEAMQAELSNGQKDMESSVQAEEFEQALQKANDLGAKADSYSEQVKQIQQAKDQYEQVAGGIQAKVQAAPSPSPFKKLEAMQAELSNGQKDMESSVQAEEFEQALQKANDLGAKADSYSEQVKQIQQAKDQYEQVAGGIQAKVQAAPSPSPFKKLEAMQAELSNGQKDMESSVQAEEFEQALQKANDLGAKADSYSEQVKQIQQAKDQYEQVAGGIQAKVQAAPSPSPFKKLEAMQAELSNGQKDMELAVTAEEFEQALQKANDLGTKADSYTEQVKQIQQAKDQYEQALGPLQAKLQAAPSPSPFKKLEAMQADLASGKQAMEASAQAEGFEQALSQANELGARTEAYAAAIAELERQKTSYETALANLEPKLGGVAKSLLAKPTATQEKLTTLPEKMKAAADGEEYEQALKLAEELSTSLTEFEATEANAGRQLETLDRGDSGPSSQPSQQGNSNQLGIPTSGGGGPSDAGAPIAGSPDPAIPAPPKTTDELYEEALAARNWGDVAYHLNGMSPDAIQKRLAELKPPNLAINIHQGALDKAGVGKDSNIGKATRAAWLDSQYRGAMMKNNLADAAYYLNEFDPANITTRLNENDETTLSKLHDAAVTKAGVGPDSNVAKMTEKSGLEQRKKDDAELQKIGITRQQLIDFYNLTKGDYAKKYGDKAMLTFPIDKARDLPEDLLARVIPGEDHTKYLQKSGRVSTNADEKSRQVENLKPATGVGTAARLGAMAAGADPDTVDKVGDVGDAADGVVASVGAAGAARAASRPVQGGGAKGNGMQSGAPTYEPKNGPNKPAPPKLGGLPVPPVKTAGASAKSITDIMRDLAPADRGQPVPLESVKDMVKAAGYDIPDEVNFIVGDPGKGKWCSYAPARGDTITWEMYKVNGKVNVNVHPDLLKSPAKGMQKMVHELYELRGLKSQLTDSGGMTEKDVSNLTDKLHLEAEREEARAWQRYQKKYAEEKQ